MKRLLQQAAAGVLSLSLISCQTTTIRPDGGEGQFSRPPDYQKTHHFFLGGLVGEATVPVGEICQGRQAVQLQSQTTFKDFLVPALIATAAASSVVLGFFQGWPESIQMTGFFVSLFVSTIYFPKTSKVWCEEKDPAETGSRQSLEAD